LLAAVYTTAGAEGSPAETPPAGSAADQQEEAVPPPGQSASTQADENTGEPSWLWQIGEGLVSDLNRLIVGIAAIALASFYLVVRALIQKPVGWWTTLRRRRGKAPSETEVGGESPPDPLLPTLQELNRKLARMSERIELLVQTSSAGGRGRESPPSTTAPSLASRGRHEAEAASVLSTRPGQTFENPLKAMRSLVEERWRGSSDLEGLPAVSQDLGLSLFGWASFDDILKSTAPSLIDLRFEPWNPRSRNPVFVGWRHSDADPLLLAPVDPVGFGIGQGLEALSKLFDLQPRPTDRVFQFHSLLRPCTVNPRGSGVYRLARRGEIGIATAGSSAPVRPADGALEIVVERAPAQPSATAFSEDLLRAVVRDELSGALGEFQRMSARPLEGLVAQVRTTLGRLESNHPMLRERALLGEPAPATAPPAVPRESSQAVARIEAPNEIDGAAGDLRPAPDSPRRPEAEMTTQSPPAPLEPSSIAGPPPATPRPTLRAFAWVDEALRDAEDAGPRPGEPGAYLRALDGLRSFLLEAAPPSRTEPRVDFAQVAMDADLFTLQAVRPEKGPHGMQFRRSDDGWVPADSIWQVFLRIAAAEEAPAGIVALVFPWSRLEKGAPQLARNLVDAGGSGPLGEYVRCLVPAILERRGHLGGYAVVQKMIVAPIEAAPRSS
jgi:hypothetical protein